MNLERQSALKSEKRQFYEHSLKNKKFPDILIIMQPLKNLCAIERLVYGWRKIMENIMCGYGHYE